MKTPDGKEITDQLLCERFPLLFGDRHADMRTTAMCWGFEVGPGWMGIIYNVASQLDPLIDRWISEHPNLNKFPSWIFSRYNMRIFWQWRCYSFLAVWSWLLVELRLRTPEPFWPRASQIKEKYGALRFYMTGETDEMFAIINKAEEQSSVTCENCGKKGKLRGRGWLYTRCAPCWKKEQKNALA